MKLLEHFKELSLHPKNAEELKDFILWLAMQGKLTVEWRSENQSVISGKELLLKNKITRQKLIESKEIRKDKYNEIIESEEILFNIPEKWAWSRLIDNCTHITDIDHKMPKAVKNGVKFLSAKDLLNDGTLNFGDDVKMISEEDYRHYSKRIKPRRGDIIYSRIGTLGKSRIVKTDERFLVSYSCCTIRTLKINIDYLNYYLGSSFLLKQALRDYRGIGVPDLGIKKIKEFTVPLPPIEEQKAIVEVVNTLFADVEQLESLTKERIQLKESFVVSELNRLTEAENTQEEWNFLQEHFSSFFTEKKNIKSLRETILQLAVQGKLTAKWRADNPNTEPATELLKRIEAEKQQLIAEKKIKKEKPLPPIEDDEIPYELPKGWLFMRLGELVTLKSGSTVSKALEFNKGDYMYVKVGGMNLPGNEKIITTSELYVKSDPKIENALIPANSIIFPKRGGAIATNKKRVVNQSILVDLNTMAMICPASFCFDYLKNWFDSIDLWLLNNGTSVPQINNKDINPLIISIPPIEEQKAIVEKVNSLMALCDELEQQIETSQTQIEQLMQSCLKEVFEQA